MPKARKHKKGPTKKKTQAQVNHALRQASSAGVAAPAAAQARRPFASPAGRGIQSLVTPAIVALGCWGLAVSFAFFYASDPNHLLYAGVAAAMALIWTVICANRVYKLYMQRQRA